MQLETKSVESPMSVEGAIVDYADKENVDLIVVGTRGRTGFAKKLLGSVGIGSCNTCIMSCDCGKIIKERDITGLER